MSRVQGNRPLIRVLAFGALGLYGALRWATLASGVSRGRLLALLGLALVLCAAGPWVVRRSRVAVLLCAVAAALAALAVAGIPVAWITHLRVSLTSQWIGNGIAAIPGVLTPYFGSDHWVLIVMTLGAAVLLLDGAIVMAFAPAQLGGLRRAVTALPLIALAAIPAALVGSKRPYLEGLALFALLAAFMWGERLERRGLVAAVVVCAAAGGAAMALAPGLRASQPWLDYQGLANGLAPGAGAETFDWSQTYGPIAWPRTGHPVLVVTAARPDYWKAQDLDGFDGHEWTQAVIGGARDVPPPAPAALARFSQRIAVSLRGMRTSDVIGAGTTTALSHLPNAVREGVAPGTWVSSAPFTRGATYQAEVYSPHPSQAELEKAGTDYAGVPSGYRTLELPIPGAGQPDPSAQIAFAPFHSGQPPQVVQGAQLGSAEAVAYASPYGPAYALAQRLSAQARTPYEFAQRVIGYLHHGFTYSETPPPRRYPLASFLFTDRVGYCQQFAGAMALLLRMGGVPARVAVGFTPGTYDSSSKGWLVTDMDAHAWVEAWIPGYGWVRFEPTPGTAPELQNTAAASPGPGKGSSARSTPGRPQRASNLGRRAGGSVPDGRPAAPTGRTSLWIGLVLAVLAAIAGLVALLTRPLRGVEDALAELERAFSLTGRPLPAGATLAGLERRMHDSPDAAAYVERLRVSRFGSGQRFPSTSQRRALRAYLAAGLGLWGWLRALWAVPPRRRIRA